MGIPTFCVRISTIVFRGYLIRRTSTPLSIMKHLNPRTPASTRGVRWFFRLLSDFQVNCDALDIEFTSLPGMTPPQKPTSVQHWPWAASRLIPRFSTVVVGGIELSGMSTTVVTPPDRPALVPVQKPSQSVRPGSFKCTCTLGKGERLLISTIETTGDLLYESG